MEAIPEFVRRGEGFEVVVFAGEEVVLDDPVAVGGVGEFEPQDLGVVLGLLEAVAGFLVDGLCFDDRKREVAAVLQEVVGTLLRTAGRFCSGDHDAAVGEALLLADLVVGPVGGVELGEHVFATCVGFGERGHFYGCTAYAVLRTGAGECPGNHRKSRHDSRKTAGGMRQISENTNVLIVEPFQ